ncbi:carboxymuconolactone decarboxylase family protein [Cupriavidus sp. 30B13]|uniref:carboxymuconolactone decarboxylase family protein n=1 Tax=Cupriavidus sp. 30B13 TaxID=3384241 RepID=UPI003B8ED764
MTEAQSAQFRRFPANLTRALLLTAASTDPYLSLGASFAKGRLAPKDRELAILRVGALSASRYERMQHVPIARGAGWTGQDIAAIESGNGIVLGPRAGTILRFVDECVHRVKVSDPTLAALRQHMSDQEVAELTLLVGHYMMTARFLETLGVELDDHPTGWDALLA